ncbi:MAG: hypothetical protein E7016_03300 [Alphaproteobacteria bacterium]|nr:hypothetical protein [Alphaproteobacteria bacterium]
MNTVTNPDIKNYLIAQSISDIRKQCGFSIEETSRYQDISAGFMKTSIIWLKNPTLLIHF